MASVRVVSSRSLTTWLLLVLLCVAGTAGALTASISGVTVTLTYTEPTANEDGTALDDLALTQVWADLGNGPELLHEELASSPAGGEQVTVTVAIQATRPHVPIFVLAVDSAGLRSTLSNIAIVSNVPPGAVQ